MSRALRELERDLAATRQTRAAVAAGAVVDMEDPDVHATDGAFLNRPTLFDDLARTEARDELAEEDARANLLEWLREYQRFVAGIHLISF